MDCPACGSFNSVLDTECACGQVLDAPRKGHEPTSPAKKGKNAAGKRARMDDETLRAEWVGPASTFLQSHTLEQTDAYLRDAGLRPGDAKKVVIGAAEELRIKRSQRTAMLWIAGGVAITMATFAVAEPGGSYVVAFGPIIYGVVKLFSAR